MWFLKQMFWPGILCNTCKLDAVNNRHQNYEVQRFGYYRIPARLLHSRKRLTAINGRYRRCAFWL